LLKNEKIARYFLNCRKEVLSQQDIAIIGAVDLDARVQ
jgi:hypothetical protein